jgi:hypothetical protein
MAATSRKETTNFGMSAMDLGIRRTGCPRP